MRQAIAGTWGTVAVLTAWIGIAITWPAFGQESAVAVPRFDGLGKHSREVTTSCADAQIYFNQGLAFLYAFNHDEAIRSFQEAARLDPSCAMAWWGIALANGPHINNPILPQERAQAAWDALGKARDSAAGATEVEQDLIAALEKRYAQEQPEDRKPLDEAFAAAMRRLWTKYPRDADIGALFAESLMDLRPWDLWTLDRQPQPGTDEIVATLEAVLKLDPHHPLGLHLYIHAVEASPNPEKADGPADRLRHLQPGLGHMVHMPSHIDVLRGRWKAASEANLRAMEADRKYRERSPQQGFYRLYMAHNYHMLAFADMMQGKRERAIGTIRNMAAAMPAEWIKENAAIADGFTAAPVEVLVRFGKWDEILAVPEFPEYLPIARAMRHCARGIAWAAKKDLDQARQEQQAFLAAQAALPAEAAFGNNKGSDLLAVAQQLLAGEIDYHAGEVDEAIAKLSRAVELEDQLRYNEPPDWITPCRHPLGAILLEARRPAEAEAVYRADLDRRPENGWSLYGLSHALALQGKKDEAAAVGVRFKQVWGEADFVLTSSCLCVPGK